MTEAMTCIEAEPLLPLVADGAIDPDSDPALFAHLATCPDCQRAVASHDLIALAIARTPAPPRRNRVIRFWPIAAAAGVALAAAGWLLAIPADPVPSRQAPVTAVAAPAVPQADPVQTAPAPDVIVLPQADGRTIYLVRQGDAWIEIDPGNLDGPAQPGHNGATSGVQVRY